MFKSTSQILNNLTLIIDSQTKFPSNTATGSDGVILFIVTDPDR